MSALGEASIDQPTTRRESVSLIVVGTDRHTNTHMLVAVDPQGKRLAELPVAARPAGRLKALAQLHGFGPVPVAADAAIMDGL